MVPQNWIINCLKMYKISDEIINFIEKIIKTRRVELTTGGTNLVAAKIRRGIFQGDALSPFLFVIAMMSLNYLLREYTAEYRLRKSQENINHLMSMDDMKLFARNEKELKTLIHAVRIYSLDIEMDFRLKMRHVNNEERETTIHRRNGTTEWREKLERSEKKKPTITWEYEADIIKQVEMKENIKKEYLRSNIKLLEIKLYSRNFIKGIHTWAVIIIRYSGSFLKWTIKEPKQIDRRIKKIMSMYNALRPRDDVDRLSVSRKEGGRGLTSIEGSIDASVPLLKEFIQNCGESLIRATRNNPDIARTKWTKKTTTTTTKKKKQKQKAKIGRKNSMENKRTSGDHPDYSIIEIGQNTKNPGKLRRLSVIQTIVENLQLTLM